MALVGYARVSSEEQDLSLQIEALKAAGCQRIFSEKRSAVSMKERVELLACLQYVREGDVLVVTRMDRIARSVSDFWKMFSDLKQRDIEFRCLLQPELDTTTTQGRLVTAIFAAFAEFENDIRRERQKEGIAKAKAEGRYEGRKPRAGSAHPMGKWSIVGRLLANGLNTVEAAEITGIPEQTIRYRYPHQRVVEIRQRSKERKLAKQRKRRSLPPSATEVVVEQPTPQPEPKKATVLERLFGGVPTKP